MMIRDKNKDRDYFLNYLAKKEKLFKMIDLAMKQRVCADDFVGENDKGIMNAYRGLSLNYMMYMIAQYSIGESIGKVKDSYKRVLQYSEKIWKENSSYVDCLWLVSLGVLLDISDEEIVLLMSVVKKYNKEDKLIDFFMKYLGKEKSRADNYIMPTPYESLDEYVEYKRKDIQVLETYLDMYWYDAHSDMAWYDMHKDRSDTYFGYWSFESGAIVKVLNLDDSGLKDVEYYPYDLVHYKG